MEIPPVQQIQVEERRQPFIAIVKNCDPGKNAKAYEESVINLLKANQIDERPMSMSNYSCSFTINLLKDEQLRLSKSELISNIDPNHEITLQ